MRKRSEELGDDSKSAAKEIHDRALELYENGEFQEAISEFKRAGEQGFNIDSIENNIGACFERMRMMDEARNHYTAALLKNPRNPFALQNMGSIFLSEGVWDGARRLYSRALAINPNNPEVRIGLARSLLQLKKMRSGFKTLQPLINESSSKELIVRVMQELSEVSAFEAIILIGQQLSEAVREDPDIVQIFGESFLELGLHDEAVGQFRKLLSIRQDARSKSLLGLALLAFGKEEEGMNLLREAEREGADDTNVLQDIVFAFHGSDRLGDALPLYKKILSTNTDDWVLWNNWGNALYNIGNYRESIPKFVVALDKNPDYEIAWNNIGNALMKMQMYAEALPYHRRALEIDWSFDYAKYAEAESFHMLGEFERAAEALDQAISLNPVCADFWILKTKLTMRSSPDDALIYAERAALLEPDCAEIYVLIAMCQEMIGMAEEAERSIRKAQEMNHGNNEEKITEMIEKIREHGISAAINNHELVQKMPIRIDEIVPISFIDSQNPAFWYRMGREHMRKGKKKKAIRALRRAFDMDSLSPTIISMLIHLEEEEGMLREYLLSAERIKSMGFSTPQLENAIIEGSEKLRQRQAAHQPQIAG